MFAISRKCKTETAKVECILSVLGWSAVTRKREMLLYCLIWQIYTKHEPKIKEIPQKSVDEIFLGSPFKTTV